MNLAERQIADIWNATYKRQLIADVYAAQLKVLNSMIILGRRANRQEIGEVSGNVAINHNIMIAMIDKGLIDKSTKPNIPGRTYDYGLTQAGREAYHYIMSGKRL